MLRSDDTIHLVVLLDEAEVFLQERSLHDLQRNALVSGKQIVDSIYVVSISNDESPCL